LLPLTVRSVEADLRVQSVQPRTDAEIIEWQHRLLAGSRARWEDPREALSHALARREEAGAAQAPPKPGTLPGLRPFEVVGIPLPAGFHVVEIESHQLGTALLEEELGAKRNMYVAHVRARHQPGRAPEAGPREQHGLGYHAGQGPARRRREGGAVGLRGQAGRLGHDRCARPGATGRRVAANPGSASRHGEDGAYFVSARAKGPDGVEDLAFTWSSWQRGIEPWRFKRAHQPRSAARRESPHRAGPAAAARPAKPCP